MTASLLHQTIVGESAPIQRLRALVARVAPTSLSVLVEGPTGSGKELVAAALHALGGRRGRLVAFNVCAIAETMFEDALFGHVRGAFSGAVQDARGYLAEADGGTVFLDEIGGLPPAAQAKLLRAVETRTYRPVGGRDDRASDFRVVAATNEPMDALVRRGRFRADLAHRLAGVVIQVPSLAERPEDVPALARHFGAKAGVAVGADASRLLQARAWPGNVRELRNVVERAAALAAGEPLLGADAILEALGQPGSFGGADEVRSDAFARARLVEVLETAGWDTAEAARQLGVNRATVYRRMARYGVTVPADLARYGGERVSIPARPRLRA